MSSVFAVYTELNSLLTSALAPLNVQVLVGSATSVTTLGPNVLLIGEIVGVRSAGSQNRIRTTTRNIPYDTSQDEYTVSMFISVSRSGGDMLTVMGVADDIWDTARAAIEDSDNLDIDGVVFEALPTGEFKFDPIADVNGRYVTVEWGIDVTARD